MTGPVSPSASLDEAIRGVIQSAPAAALAERLGTDAKHLYRYATVQANESNEHRHLPAALIAPLTLATGRRDIVAHLAAQIGCVLVPMGAPAVETAASLVAGLAAVMTEAADVQREGADVLVAPQSAQERREMAQAAYELATAAMALHARLRSAA